jgi:protein-L-isoaspartate(D-aspartate) O-methyltransferase
VPDWLDRQLRRRGIADERVLAAMAEVPREEFVPAQARRHAHADAALDIGHGQTISQPYIVALICSALELGGDEHVLDVGTGSGYQAAVLSRLAARVTSIERIPELADAARARLEPYGVEVLVGDGTRGVPERAPFDAIAVAAAAADVPAALRDQLAPGGRLVLPVGESLVRLRGGEVRYLSAVRFVPLVSAAAEEGTEGPR